MHKSFLRAKKRAPRSLLMVILVIGAIFAFLMWIIVSVDPFQPANPFLRQVTIGQSVIGDWRYGGSNTNGSMKFYDAYQYVTIPEDSSTFAADGVFVALAGHTPSTVTFEPVYESEVLGPASYIWIILVIAAIAAFVLKKKRLLVARMKKHKRLFSRRQR